MLISMIAALGRDRVIGRNKGLPWRLPADVRRFKTLTMGRPVLMGRKTHESIGKPLPGRTNIVLTTATDYRAEGCVVVHSLDAALAACAGADEAMIIGGATLYAQMLPSAARLYLTYVHAHFDGDEYFPAFDEAGWSRVEGEDFDPDDRNPYAYSFVTLERVRFDSSTANPKVATIL